MIYSLQVTVAAAGTAVQASTDSAERLYWFRAHQSNTGENIYIGNDGDDDVTDANGLCLNKLDAPILFRCRLSELYVDADTSGDKLCVLTVLE